MDEGHIRKFCHLGKEERDFMEAAYAKYGISPRRYHKILKLARTLADMDGENNIQTRHLAASIHYTRFLRQRENMEGQE